MAHTVKVWKSGKGLAVGVPKSAQEIQGIQAGEYVEVTFKRILKNNNSEIPDLDTEERGGSKGNSKTTPPTKDLDPVPPSTSSNKIRFGNGGQKNG